MQTVVKKNLTAFWDYQVDENRLDEFLMRYSEGGSWFATLIVIVKFVMVLLHGQLAVEHGFSDYQESLNWKSHCKKSIKKYCRKTLPLEWWKRVVD